MKTETKFLAFGGAFRLLAASDTVKAIDKFAGPEFRLTWERELLPLFKDQEAQLADFFSSAVTFVGALEDNLGVFVYYNAWSDVAFIIGVDTNAEKILDGALMCGEALRGEVLADDTGPHPAWQRIPKALPIAMAEMYTKTAAAIERLYPPMAGKYFFLPGELRERLQTPARDRTFLKLRMFARMKMYEQLLDAKPATDASDVRAAIIALRNALRGEDQTAFEPLNLERRSKDAVSNIFLLAKDVRHAFATTYYVTHPDGAVLVMVSSHFPVGFVCLYLKRNAEARLKPSSVEYYLFDKLGLLLN